MRRHAFVTKFPRADKGEAGHACKKHTEVLRPLPTGNIIPTGRKIRTCNPSTRLETLPPNHFPRQQSNPQHSTKRNASSQVQNPLRALRVTPNTTRRKQRLRRKRRNNTKQPAPERRQAGPRTTHRSREDLRRPAVQDGVEHALEEVLHHVEADVGGLGVDGGEDEDAHRHERGGDAHRQLAPEHGHAVHHAAEDDGYNAGGVDGEVVFVRRLDGEAELAVLGGEDGGEVGAWCDVS